ncbi:MAG: DUF4760 domain-containing protein [Proteobacteria bacterium]|nr:DUF4760 domain-containing protein [Pseudomonadota bacterium]
MNDSADKLAMVKLRFPIGFSVVTTVIVLAVTAVFYTLTESLEKTAIFFGAAVAAGGTVAAAFYAARSLNAIIFNQAVSFAREEALETHGKKVRALEYAARWNAPAMHNCRAVCRKILEVRGQPEQEIIEFGDREAIIITNIFNFFEEMAFSIEHNIIDEDLAKNIFYGLVVICFQVMEPWVEHERTKKGIPTILIAVQKLYNNWKVGENRV